MKRRGLSLLLLAAVLLALCGSISADAAIQPSFFVRVKAGSGADYSEFELYILAGGERVVDLGLIKTERGSGTWATQTGFIRTAANGQPVCLAAEYRGRKQTFALSDSLLKRYRIELTLDWEQGSLEPDEPSLGNVILGAVGRLLLTLLLEGVVFYLFGYRRKGSWILFFAVNLLTQGALSYLMSRGIWNMGVPWLSFWAVEGYITLLEAAVYCLLLREHKGSRAALCAICANGASAVLGGALLSALQKLF